MILSLAIAMVKGLHKTKYILAAAGIGATAAAIAAGIYYHAMREQKK